MAELWQLSASEGAEQIRRRKISSEALVRACLERIEAVEPVIRAFVDLQAEQALQQARLADSMTSASDRLLHGVPVAVKEVLDVRGMRCSWGTPIHRRRIPFGDAAAVERLKAAGAIVLGTTVSTEYAIAAAGPTSNPYDPCRTPGGSSSGSAAAVASGMVPLALGSQSIGSIVRPSTYCGVYGLKATRGAISTSGCMPLAKELDHVGAIARSAEDLALACRVLFGYDASDSASHVVEPPPLTGWSLPREVVRIDGGLYGRVERESREAVNRTVKGLVAAGLEMRRLKLPEEFERISWCVQTLLCRGMYVYHGDERARCGGRMSERVRALIDEGAGISDAEYQQAWDLVGRLSGFLGSHIGEGSVAVCAATDGIAPPLGDGTGSPMPQALWTVVGWPVVALPCGRHRDLPIGVQLVTGPGDEQLLFSAARVAREGGARMPGSD